MDASLPVQRFSVTACEVLGVVSRIGWDMLPQREADGFGPEEAAEQIEHAPGYYMLADEAQSAE
jgi:hypothetical protein